MSAKTNFEVEKVGNKNSLICGHKDYDLIHIDKNHADSNQLILVNSTNIRYTNDSDDIPVIEKMFSSKVSSARTFFTYGKASDPPSPLHD